MKINGSYIKANGVCSSVKKRSLVVDGHKTSISLEEEFWAVFGEVAHRRSTTYSHLAGQIDQTRKKSQNLSSAIRVYLLESVMAAARESSKLAAETQAKLKALIAERDHAAKTKSGLAPLSAVIARGRADA